jgi:hypothetical protein
MPPSLELGRALGPAGPSPLGPAVARETPRGPLNADAPRPPALAPAPGPSDAGAERSVATHRTDTGPLGLSRFGVVSRFRCRILFASRARGDLSQMPDGRRSRETAQHPAEPVEGIVLVTVSQRDSREQAERPNRSHPPQSQLSCIQRRVDEMPRATALHPHHAQHGCWDSGVLPRARNHPNLHHGGRADTVK